MKNKKYILILAFILLVSVIITGCGSGNINDTAQLKQDANDTLDEFFKGMENRSLSTIDGTLSPNFNYTNGVSMNKQEFLDLMSLAFIEGALFLELELNNRVNELISNTKIKISGSLYTEAYDIDGYYSIDSYPAQFIVEKENNGWKITKWIDS